ncbi:exonuclease domain-containing protein [Kineococcus sp. SYSU DK006]|uniref:exonuclease domain-containing protein n=1 Tax=Kineococcus sp. SYSU DK006 TaxID=3383127 RepID=UPI003D7C5E92
MTILTRATTHGDLASGTATGAHVLRRHWRTGRVLLSAAQDERAWGVEEDEAEELHRELLARALVEGDRAGAQQHQGLLQLRRALRQVEHLDVHHRAALCAPGELPRLTVDHPAVEATHEVLRRGAPDCACNESYYSRVVDDEALPAIVRAIAWRLREAHQQLAARAQAHHWARSLIQPVDASGADGTTTPRCGAVILDTETHELHGAVIELAVLDAATGQVLLNTLVNPHRPIAPAAQAVHGISDADVAGAPDLAEVWPQLLTFLARRQVLAWNATYDAQVLTQAATDAGLPWPSELSTDAARGHLDPVTGLPPAWRCLMRTDAAFRMSQRWHALRGNHRAIGDCRAALQRLHELAAPGASRTPHRVPAPVPARRPKATGSTTTTTTTATTKESHR